MRRRKNFLQAMRDAKAKAGELATMMKLTIGEPIKIVEIKQMDHKV